MICFSFGDEMQNLICSAFTTGLTSQKNKIEFIFDLPNICSLSINAFLCLFEEEDLVLHKFKELDIDIKLGDPERCHNQLD